MDDDSDARPENAPPAPDVVRRRARPNLTDIAEVIGRLGPGGTLEHAATPGLGETATEAALRQAGATPRKAGTGTVWMP